MVATQGPGQCDSEQRPRVRIRFPINGARCHRADAPHCKREQRLPEQTMCLHRGYCRACFHDPFGLRAESDTGNFCPCQEKDSRGLIQSVHQWRLNAQGRQGRVQSSHSALWQSYTIWVNQDRWLLRTRAIGSEVESHGGVGVIKSQLVHKMATVLNKAIRRAFVPFKYPRLQPRAIINIDLMMVAEGTSASSHRQSTCRDASPSPRLSRRSSWSVLFSSAPAFSHPY